MPFIKILDNDDEDLIFTAFGARIDLRSQAHGQSEMKWLHSYPFADDEIISCLDTKRTDDEILFGAGSLNGIVYIIKIPIIDRVIFKNHCDQIMDIKFNPIPEITTVLT